MGRVVLGLPDEVVMELFIEFCGEAFAIDQRAQPQKNCL